MAVDSGEGATSMGGEPPAAGAAGAEGAAEGAAPVEAAPVGGAPAAGVDGAGSSTDAMAADGGGRRAVCGGEAVDGGGGAGDGKREVPVLGEVIQVEVEEGQTFWKNAEVAGDAVDASTCASRTTRTSSSSTAWRTSTRRAAHRPHQRHLEARHLEGGAARVPLQAARLPYRRCKGDQRVEEDGPLSANILKKFEKRPQAGEAIDKSHERHLQIERVISHRHRRGRSSTS